MSHALGKNVFHVTGPFNRHMLENFLIFVQEVDRAEENEITLLINSPGGSLSVLKTMLDVMYSSQVEFTTVASGLAASCGLLLLMAGDKRLAFPEADIMSHPFSSGSKGTYWDLVADRDMLDRTHKFMLHHYMLHTGLAKEDVENYLLQPTDVWLTAKQAMELNIVDGVVSKHAKPIGSVAKQKNLIARKKNILKEAEKLMKQFESKEDNNSKEKGK